MFEWKTIIKVAAAVGLVSFAVKLSAGLAEVLVDRISYMARLVRWTVEWLT